MKKLSLFCAVGAVLLSGQAYADPRLTGTLKAIIQEDTKHELQKNLSTGEVLKDQKSGRAEMTGSSRLKFSGSNKVNDLMTFAYSIEYDLRLDSSRSSTFRPRSTYVSLDHKGYGRIRAGRMTSPEDDLDVGVTVGDNWGVALPFTGFGGRSNNAIQYYSPYFGKDKGTRVKLHYGMDENDSSDRAFNTYVDGVATQKRRDSFVAQIMHTNKKYGWGFAYTHAGSDFSALTGMVRYQFTPKLHMALLTRQADYNSGSNETGAFVSASYNLDKDWRAYGQVGYAENFSGRKGADVVIGAVGVAKEIKASVGRATIFAELAGERYERSGSNNINLREDQYGFGTGLVYKF